MIHQDHVPVLLEEVLRQLKTDRAGVYLDCTLGMGGHTGAVLERNPQAEVIGIDVDERSLRKAGENLKSFSDRLQLVHSDFRLLPDLDLDFTRIRGVLVDLGYSSFQLDDPERGFSFNQEGPLDMRLDQRGNITAARILNKYSETRLAQVFRDYGELRQSKRLAAAIVSRRKIRKLETTTQLFQIVEEVCRWRVQKGKSHPAARVFQALRIEINQELTGLADFLEQTIHSLVPQSRIAVISFHSLEDRIVKHTLAALASETPEGSQIKLLTKKPVIPSPAEVSSNFRSRSAKLRAAEKR